MILKYILLADAANQSREGKMNIAGEFNTMFSPGFPMAYPSFVIVARLEANPGEGLDHAAQLKITDADGKQLLATPPLPIKFGVGGPGIPARSDIMMGIAGFVVPAPGDYTVHLFVDGVQRGDLTLYARIVPAA